MHNLENLKNELQTIISKTNVAFEDVTYVREDGFYILRVSLENSASLEDTAEITNLINPVIDSYIESANLDVDMLDVCTVGEDPNYTWEDLGNLTDEYLFIKLVNENKDTGSHFIKGDFVSFEEDVLTVKLNLKGRMKNIKLHAEDVISIQRDYKI